MPQSRMASLVEARKSSSHRPRHSGDSRDSGIVLLTTLAILILLSIIGMVAMSSSVVEFRVVSNYQFYQENLAMAESAENFASKMAVDRQNLDYQVFLDECVHQGSEYIENGKINAIEVQEKWGADISVCDFEIRQSWSEDAPVIKQSFEDVEFVVLIDNRDDSRYDYWTFARSTQNDGDVMVEVGYK